MKPTTPRDLLIAFLVAGVLAHLVVTLTYGGLPSFPALAGATLAVLGVAEAVAGRILKARVERRPGSKPVEPLVAARAVLVAQASAMGGALVGGLWAGLLVYTAPRASSISAASSDTTAAIVGLLSAAVLVAGALWLEHCCRTPDEPDHPDGSAG